jgi:hypothetical protein
VAAGLSFRETMRGSYWLLAAPTDERALALHVEAHAEDVRELATGAGFRLRGTLDAERLATRADAEGTLGFRLLDERRLPYRLRFRGDDGRRYELSGQKEFLGLAPVASLTTLPASLYDDRGAEIGRATLRFDWRTSGGAWLRSFRLHLFA